MYINIYVLYINHKHKSLAKQSAISVLSLHVQQQAYKAYAQLEGNVNKKLLNKD